MTFRAQFIVKQMSSCCVEASMLHLARTRKSDCSSRDAVRSNGMMDPIHGVALGWYVVPLLGTSYEVFVFTQGFALGWYAVRLQRTSC